ncbi:MAG: ArsR/SmtB family transcription factor [Maricaulaceae bacterium]
MQTDGPSHPSSNAEANAADDAAGLAVTAAAEPMAKAASRVAKTLKLLTNETRLMALCLLVEAGEQSVGELAARVGVSDQAMSQQLAILRHNGAVSARRSGQSIRYRLHRPDLVILMGTLHQLYCAENSNADPPADR